MPESFIPQEALGVPTAESLPQTQDVITRAELPVAPDQEHLRTKTRLGYAIYDLTGEVQQYRGKENTIYANVVTGERFFAKTVSQQDGAYFDDVAGMAREKLLLDYLASTGVVPQTGALRIYPNQKRARLLLEVLEGQSLDSMEFDDEVMSIDQAAEIITSTAQSLQRVHDAGVLVGDVNRGTFLVNTAEEAPSTKILDLEIGCHVEDSPERLANLAAWCARNDHGARLALAETAGAADGKLLQRIEMHRWGKVMAEWLLGDLDDWPDMDLDEPYAAQLSQMEDYIGESVKADVEQNCRRFYKKYYEPLKLAGREVESEDEYVATEMAKDYPKYLKKAAPGVYFKALLENFEFKIPAELREFIAQALSPNVHERPADFTAIAA